MKNLFLLTLLAIVGIRTVQAGVDINISIVNNNSCNIGISLQQRRVANCPFNFANDWLVFQGWTIHPGETINYEFHGQHGPCDDVTAWRVITDTGIEVMPQTGGSAQVFKAVLGDGSGSCTDIVDHQDPGDGDSDNRDVDDSSSDDTDLDNGDCGMARWWVSEPYVSLSLKDEPLGYQPVQGSRISFKLGFKQREFTTGFNPDLFSVGKRWNFPWYSLVTVSGSAENVHLPNGKEISFQSSSPDYLTNTRLTGSTNSGFTLSYPDGSQDVYGFIVTNASGAFLEAFRTEHWNPQAQKTFFYYDNYAPGASPIMRLKYVVDGDGRTNSIYYVASNSYSTNLIDHVVDAFGRTAYLGYDNSGHLTNITDVAQIVSSFTYSSDMVTILTTPYGNTAFQATTATNARSVLVIQPDGGKQLYLYQDNTPSMPSFYTPGQIPVTSPFANTFDTNSLNLRNSFHWGPRQYAVLSTTNIASFTTNDFLKARMKHWLIGPAHSPGDTVSMQRNPSPDGSGRGEGQKMWYDYSGKTDMSHEGAQVLQLYIAEVLPDGTTRFTRLLRNVLGAVTNEIGTYSVADGGTVLLRTNIYVYDSTGVDLLLAENALGVMVSSNIYNGYHEVATNYDALSEKTVYSYDPSNRLTSSTCPTGLVTTNIYGNDGFLTQQIVIGFSTNTYTYLGGLVYTHTDARGLTTTNTWDNLQRLRRVDYPDGTFIINTYQFLDLVRVNDRMGFTNSYAYDNMRRLTNSIDANGHQIVYNYCSCGALDSIRDAAGNFTSFNRDNLGRATNIIYADGYSVTNQFNLIGQITNITDSANASVTNGFNNQGLQVIVTNAFGRVQSLACDILDRVTNSIDINGVAVNTTYENLNRPISRSYPDGGVELFGYSLNVPAATTYTNQLLQRTLYDYDAAGRKIAETNANLEITRFGYSGPGDLLTLVDGRGQTTSWHYDQFGRATNKVDAVSNVIFRYSYDPDSRLTNRWTPVTSNTVYLYDSVGNLTTVRYQHATNTFSYDSMNRLTNMVDAVGTTIYSYNAAGQVLSEDGPWASDTVSYTYKNRLRTALSLPAPNASPWSQTYGYDTARRLTNVTSSAGAFTYLLGGRGGASPLIKKLLLPNGAYITNYYDGNVRLLGTYLRNNGNTNLDTCDYVYNVGNQRTQQVFIAGNFLNYTYDNIGQLKTAYGKELGAVTNRMQEQLGYVYDAAGNLNYRTNNTLLQQFNVNSLNELTVVSNAEKLTVTGITTSPATSVTVNGSSATLYMDATFASANQPWASGNNSYTAIAQDSYGRRDTNSITVDIESSNSVAYDLNGNMLTNGTRVFEYDDENQLTRITQPNTWKSEFSYDGKMRRRTQTNYTWNGNSWLPTNGIHYVYDGNLVIQERDGSNLPQVTYTRGVDLRGGLQRGGGIGGLLARTANPMTLSAQLVAFATAFYHTDGNGNITSLIYSNQNIAAKYKYDPFGHILSQSGPLADANLYRFSSKEYHLPSGLIYYLHRYYDPLLQRWLNRDPIQEIGGLNLYESIGNEPSDNVDFFGDSNFNTWSTATSPSATMFPIIYPPPVYTPIDWNKIPSGPFPTPLPPDPGSLAASPSLTTQMLENSLGADGDSPLARALVEQNANAIANILLPAVLGPCGGGDVALVTEGVDSSLLQKYMSGSGGRWGSSATRALNNDLATQLENQGFEVTGGAGRAAEEWLPGPGGGTTGGTFVDITASDGTTTIRIQTMSTYANGVPTANEAAAANRIQSAFSQDILILIPKKP